MKIKTAKRAIPQYPNLKRGNMKKKAMAIKRNEKRIFGHSGKKDERTTSTTSSSGFNPILLIIQLSINSIYYSTKESKKKKQFLQTYLPYQIHF